MNNIKTIDDFFQFYKTILEENKEIKITEDMIYNSIININIPIDQKDIEIDSLFDEWKTRYTSLDININKEYIEMSKGIIDIPSPIKVYISLSYNHIYKNVNKILTFLNNKTFQMRISKSIRNDNIIIRLTNIEDVKELDSFIKENIDEGLLNVNPFTYIYNNIGLTIDGNISFISVISNLIYNYLLEKKDTESIQKYDFYNYIIDEYNSKFIELSKYSKINIPLIDNVYYNERDIVFYKNLLELILKSSEEKFNIKKFEHHFNECNDIEKLINYKKTFNIYNTIILLKKIESNNDNNIVDKLNKYIETGDKKYITNKGSLRTYMYINNFRQNVQKLLKDNNISLLDLYNKLIVYNDNEENLLDENEISKKLKDIIQNMSELMDYQSAIDLIQMYLETNDISLLTRENNIRNEFIDNNLRNKILKLLLNKNISFSTYCANIDNYIIVEEKPVFDYIEKIDNVDDEDDFDLDTHLDITSIMISALDEPKEDNQETKEEIEEVKEENIDIINSIDNILNEINNDKNEKTVNFEENDIQDLINIDDNNEKILTEAILETYNKYQKLYEENNIKFDGYALVNYALTSILEKNDYSSFTRLNEARKNISLLSNQDIFNIITNKLNMDNLNIEDCNHEKIQSVIRSYLNELLEK